MINISKDKKLALIIILIIGIPLALYFVINNQNSYLKCETHKEKLFYMKIDRPNKVRIFSNPTFLKGNDFTYYTELKITETDIFIRKKDPFLGRQFPYDDMRLNRLNLNLYGWGTNKVLYHGSKLGSCIKINKEKRKI